jgi:hypothetical protein
MTGTTKGGFDVDPLDALAPSAQAGGCCGMPAATAATATPTDSSTGGCCGTAPMEQQASTGSGCCG